MIADLYISPDLEQYLTSTSNHDQAKNNFLMKQRKMRTIPAHIVLGPDRQLP